MFLIHPPDGVPISNVPEVLKRSNSRKIAELVVNYFRFSYEFDQNSYIRRQSKSYLDQSQHFSKNFTNGNYKRDVFGRLEFDLTDFKLPNEALRSQVYFDNDQVYPLFKVVY